MSEVLDLFIGRARGVSIADAAQRLGLKLKAQPSENPMSCPRCGGKDRFAINTKKEKWNCRGCGAGGNDSIGLAAHVRGLDVTARAEFLDACGSVLGEVVPDAAEQLSETRRAELAVEAAARAERSRIEAETRDQQANEFRDKERARCAGIYDAAIPVTVGSTVVRYIAMRTGLGPELLPFLASVRMQDRLPYWHGKDDRGYARDIWCGPAMVLPFVDSAGDLIGIHQTWIDLREQSKRRPPLFALSSTGAKAGRPNIAGCRTLSWPEANDIAAGYYEPLPGKKMRGSKKGGLLPVAGDMTASRWVVGEGFENVAAWFGAEMTEDRHLALSTFYAAAGDIGNLAGAAARTGRFAHPSEGKEDARGRIRPVMMPSPDPDPERLGEGFPLGGHVRELVFLGDGDSEPVWTATMMARAETRAGLIVPDLAVSTIWPPRGRDWAQLIAAAQANVNLPPSKASSA